MNNDGEIILPGAFVGAKRVVEDFSQGTLPRYERDVQIQSYVISRRVNVPVTVDDSMSNMKNYIEKVGAKMTKTHSDKREDMIAEALNTPQGKVALTTAMAAPINTSIMYQNIGRKLLMFDELPDKYPGARSAVSDYMKKWVQK